MSGQSAPKGMSARLLTMKFMQRGVAAGSSLSTPTPEAEHSAKRRKVSHPGGGSSPSVVDQQAIRAALEEEERKRQAAIERQAVELGDAHWVLDFKNQPPKGLLNQANPLNVVQVGFRQLDARGRSGSTSSEDDSESDRRADVVQIRRFNMKSKSEHHGTKTGNDGSDSESNSDPDPGSDSNDDALRSGNKRKSQNAATRDRVDSTSDLPRKRLKSEHSKRKSAEVSRSQKIAQERRKKEVNLNKLSSISAFTPAAPKCHGCGKTGHILSGCPNRRR